MNKEEMLRREAEEGVLTAEDILDIKQLHSDGRSNEDIGMGLDLSTETVGKALSRGIHPQPNKAKEAGGGDDEDEG